MIVFLDSNIVIYAVENAPVYGPMAAARLGKAVAAGDTFMVSDLTRMESLVGPLKSGNKIVLANCLAFFALPEVKVVGITAAVCDRAAMIRATTSFKPMDSLQLAAAVEHGADVFLTKDGQLDSFTDVTVERLR